MNMPAATDPPYWVAYSEVAQHDLIDIYGRSVQLGRGADVLSAAKVIDERLHRDPLDFGNARNFLPHWKLKVHNGIQPPLVVYYGVEEEQRLVFVHRFRTLPRTGF